MLLDIPLESLELQWKHSRGQLEYSLQIGVDSMTKASLLTSSCSVVLLEPQQGFRAVVKLLRQGSELKRPRGLLAAKVS